MRTLSTFLFTLAITFAFVSTSFSQYLSTAQNPKPGGSPDGVESLVTINYDGDNFDSIGDGGTTFIAGARFTPSITGPLTGGELRFVQFYYAQVATGLTIKIYNSGTATDPGALLLDQPLTLGSLIVPGWNEVELSTYIPISGNDLWICLEVADASGVNFPLGCDAGPVNPNGDFVNDTGVWQHLADFGLNYNWNIRGVVEDSPAPLALFFDNFDSYVAGQLLAQQNPTDWTTWSNQPGGGEDVLVSNAQSSSPSNSANVLANDDLVKVLGSYTTGKYEITFDLFIPNGMTGYFNTLNTWPATTNGHWAMQVYFNTGGLGNMDAGGALIAPFTYSYDTWMNIKVTADLDNNVGEVWLDGLLLHTWQWSAGTFGSGFLSLAANNFYGGGTNGTINYYLDNYRFDYLTVVPVELTSFAATADNGNVNLSWSTATELNNSGFQIERSNGGEYQVIGFVAGHGTTTEAKNYSYSDQNVNAGTYSYRLKQIDYNGTFEYSNSIEVEVIGVVEFALDQNYPNPFNPTTSINFSLAEPTFVRLAIYNLLGEELEVLKNENMNAGSYNVSFDASSLPSGMYLYKIETAQFSSVRKMMLMK